MGEQIQIAVLFRAYEIYENPEIVYVFVEFIYVCKRFIGNGAVRKRVSAMLDNINVIAVVEKIIRRFVPFFRRFGKSVRNYYRRFRLRIVRRGGRI